jgi:hypothetical protein
MAELQDKLKDTKIAQKYGLIKDKGTNPTKFDMRQLYAEFESTSAATSIPPDPRLLL